MTNGKIIAMWSGPRNLSTALMRSFGNRSDTKIVLDEPFYSAYLSETGKDHPMKEQVIASQSPSWYEVETLCKQQTPGITYQKHMTQHMIKDDLNWIHQLCNCFLIRNPRDVAKSFLKSWSEGDFIDMGFSQQALIFDLVCNKNNKIAPVIDADLLRSDPERVLRKLCKEIDISWDNKMLEWDSGIKDYDGIWAEHWYPSVKTSTFFKPLSENKDVILSDNEERIAQEAMPFYEKLLKHAL
tara:strand:+ start:277 stop:999 length:723 start_codon:yes stop_codon:yes gene_type:complete